jgi:phage terminase small subunit
MQHAATLVLVCPAVRTYNRLATHYYGKHRTMPSNTESSLEHRVPINAVSATVGTPLENERHERFVLALLAGEPLGDAYVLAGYRVGSRAAAWNHGCRLRAQPAVQARLRELTAQAAAAVVIDRVTLLAELHEIATADPSELSRVVIDPCPACWPDEALGAAADRWLTGQGEPPDTTAPEPRCKSCRGRGVSRVVHTATENLSGSARRLYAGAKTKSDGSVEVAIVDQLAARKELHELLGMRIQRSESKNLHLTATVDAKATTDVSADNLLALWKDTRGDRK